MRRMAGPVVTLLHNGSSYHALPALLSDLHEALGSLAAHNGSDLRSGAWIRAPMPALDLSENSGLKADQLPWVFKGMC